MASKSKDAKDLKPEPFPINYVHGELVDRRPEAVLKEYYARDRAGATQIERRIRGEEVPADIKADRLRLLRAGLLETPVRAPDASLRIEPGSVIGKPMVDVRARDKVMGRAVYSADVYLPGMLYVKALRSPHPHAKVTSIDTSKAESYPGVMAVITYDDVPKGPGILHPSLTSEPAYAGEPVAAVAAESEAAAEEAVELIDVKWEKLPFVLDPKEALKDGAPKVRTSLPSNAVRNPQFSYNRGDTGSGFAEADLTVEVEIQTSFEQHVAMEPHNAVAVWDRDTLTVWSTNQYPHGIVNGMSTQLGLPAANIRVLAPDSGGTWGDKGTARPYHIITAVLAKKTQRPVRWDLTRREIFADADHNFPLSAKAKMGLKRDGTITAIEGTSYVAGGAYGGFFGNSDDWEAMTRLYKVPNVKVNGYTAYTNQGNAGALRSVGEASGIFFTEALINRAAEALDMDPVEFRLKNIETSVDQVVNLPFSSNGLREAIERGAELFKWKERWKGWKKGTRDLSKAQKGIGMMCFECNKGANSIPPMAAVVQVQSDGSVVINSGAADIGGGQRTTWMMIVAEALGVKFENVRINSMDSLAGPDSGIIAGSRGTKAVGLAMLTAANDARRKLLLGVQNKWKLPDANDIDIKDGVVFRKSDPDNPAYRMTMREAVGSGVIEVEGRFLPAGGTIVGEARVPIPSGYSQKTFGTGFFEVLADPGTGFVKVTDAVQVHDVGRAINPMALANQIHGGMMHGINKALTEEEVYDSATGILVNGNLDEYKLHMIDALPEKLQVDWVEPFDVTGPFGAKGIGEPALLPPSASIHAAIYDALGVRVDHQPMSPPRILDALRTRST